jgi:hypothetical protein
MGKRPGGGIGRAEEGNDPRTRFLRSEAQISKQARMSKMEDSKHFVRNLEF